MNSSFSEPAAILKALHGALDDLNELGRTLELGRNEDEAPAPDLPPPDPRKQAKAAMTMIAVRDSLEAMAALGGRGDARELAEALLRAVIQYVLMGRHEDALHFYETVRPTLEPAKAAKPLAAAASFIISAAAGIDDDSFSSRRLKRLLCLFRRVKPLARLDEDAAIELTAAAGNLVFGCVVLARTTPALEVLGHMRELGAGLGLGASIRLNVTVVKNVQQGAAAPAPADRAGPPAEGVYERPKLTLVSDPKDRRDRKDREGAAGLYTGLASSSARFDDLEEILAQASVNAVCCCAMSAGHSQAAEEIFRSMPRLADQAVEAELKAMASVNLISSMLKDGRRPEAVEVFRTLQPLARLCEEGPSLLAKAAVELLSSTQSSCLEEDEELFNSIVHLGAGEEFEIEKAKAAGNFVYRCGELNEQRRGLAFYRRHLDSVEGSEELLDVRLKAVVSLINDFHKAGDFKTANELVKRMDDFGPTPYMLEAKAIAAHSLVVALCLKGQSRKALPVYRDMAKLGADHDVVVPRLVSAFFLASHLLEAGELEEALRIYNSLDDFEPSRLLYLYRLKTLINLSHSFGDAGLRTSTANLFMTAAEAVLAHPEWHDGNSQDGDEDGPDDDELDEDFDEDGMPLNWESDEADSGAEIRAAAAAAAAGDGRRDDRDDREDDDEDDDEEQDYEFDKENLLDLLAETAFNLVFDYSAASFFEQALATVDYMAKFGSRPVVVSERARAFFQIATDACLVGKHALAVRVFKKMKALGDDQEVRRNRLRAGVNIIGGQIRRGDDRMAIKIYKELETIPCDDSLAEDFCRASFNMLMCHLSAGRLQRGRQVFETMSRLPAQEAVWNIRSDACLIVLTYFIVNNWEDEAQRVYDMFGELGCSGAVVENRFKAAEVMRDYHDACGRRKKAKWFRQEAARLKQETIRSKKEESRLKKEAAGLKKKKISQKSTLPPPSSPESSPESGATE